MSSDLCWWKIECVTTYFYWFLPLQEWRSLILSTIVTYFIHCMVEWKTDNCSKNKPIAGLQSWKYKPFFVKEAQLIIQNITFEGADIISQSLTANPYGISTHSHDHNTYVTCIYINNSSSFTSICGLCMCCYRVLGQVLGVEEPNGTAIHPIENITTTEWGLHNLFDTLRIWFTVSCIHLNLWSWYISFTNEQ